MLNMESRAESIFKKEGGVPQLKRLKAYASTLTRMSDSAINFGPAVVAQTQFLYKMQSIPALCLVKNRSQIYSLDLQRNYEYFSLLSALLICLFVLSKPS